MNLPPELQAEIRRVMDDYWARYFHGDLDAWLQYLPDDYRNIGSTEVEIWNSKEEVLTYTLAVIDQMAGNVDLRNKQVQVIPYPPYFMVHELGDLFINTGEDWAFYAKFRLSSLIRKADDGWQVLHQHGSVPDAKAQEGESIGFEKISRENQELREAVKRRTVELEHKNRELEIEAALERVRTQAMGMAKPDDVLNICQALFTELRSLGFGEIRNALINFWHDEQGFMLDYDHSDFTGGHITRIPYSDHPTFAEFQRQMRSATDAFVELVVRGEQLESWKARRRSIGEYEDLRLADLPALYYYFYSIGVGAVGISTFAALSEEKRVVLKRFRNAFELAYRRYMDIVQAEAQAVQAQLDLIQIQTEKARAEEALTELRATQAQLIQKEKLASLGELTAGIAHEIQNPLNFVNNFSEVSAELVGELRDEAARADRDPAVVGELIDDLAQNLEKITHHGHRASRIVKGMLEHARPSTGQKVPTDLTALVEEYLRLAYRGARGNDETWSAERKTHFDPGVGLVDTVPQDLGRVLLNLFSNAFYALREKQKTAGPDFQPTVIVNTQRVDGQVRITVADNGTGIPEAVAAKVFQPFFTTKPTGEGTGLGLSLSYDVVTNGHGGTLTVRSVEGQFSEFLIALPA